MTTRVISLFALVALLGTIAWSLLGCSQADAAKVPTIRRDGRIEVEFWHAMGGRHARSLNELIDQFNKRQTKYYVVGINQGSYQSLSQKLIASLYAGTNPAVSQMYESWANRYFTYGYLQPVEHFLAEDPAYAKQLKADLLPVFLENGRLPDPKTGEEVLATLPFNKSVYMLMINDTLMRELGHEKPPQTWAELLALSRQMVVRKGNTIERYGFATRATLEAFTVNLFMTGLNYLDEDEKIQFDGPEGQHAMALLSEFVSGEERSGYVEAGYLNSVFGAQKVGMYIGSTASFPFNDQAVGNKFIWRAYPLPASDGEHAGRTLAQGTNIGIFSKVPAEEQEGAWEFIKFLLEPESVAKWSMDTGYVPVSHSALNLPKMKEFFEKNPNYGAAASVLDDLMFEPRHIYWESTRKAVEQSVAAVLSGTSTPEAALKEARRMTQLIIDSESNRKQ